MGELLTQWHALYEMMKNDFPSSTLCHEVQGGLGEGKLKHGDRDSLIGDVCVTSVCIFQGAGNPLIAMTDIDISIM